MAVNLMDSNGDPLVVTLADRSEVVGDSTLKIKPMYSTEINFLGDVQHQPNAYIGYRHGPGWVNFENYNFLKGRDSTGNHIRANVVCNNLYRVASIVAEKYFNEGGTTVNSNWFEVGVLKWSQSIAGTVLVMIQSLADLAPMTKYHLSAYMDGYNLATHFSENKIGYNGNDSSIGFVITPFFIKPAAAGSHQLNINFRCSSGWASLKYCDIKVILI